MHIYAYTKAHENGRFVDLAMRTYLHVTTPTAITVVADRTSPKWKPALTELGWDQAIEMLKHYPIVVACAYEAERIRKRAPLLIIPPHPADLEMTVQQATDVLGDRICQWIFGCDCDVARRALLVAEVNGVRGGTA